ncbi:hypothetical protein [Aestuariibaculum sediminum]|uniref:Uncharacterized protein n=1 Tax=Aestuariibaculum sediminum TaxID=2770637 RepID=A0A8J6UBW4_9FLAO|nr:hypothetical protein [Aestuariibaculum sediminum]MBD0831524.1 hypothetical protein [Aestuariibaculum sediminum]
MTLNENQKLIHNGLKSIGEEISDFYLSGLSMIADEGLPSRTYLIAHSAREIDGGIRDILAPKEEKSKKQKELSLEGELKDTKGHVASILVAIDLPIDDPFALEYIDVATKFVKYTHRSGAFKSSRDSTDIIFLWERYESILLKLLGNFINQLKQIERILKFDKPTEEILHTIKNLFKNRQKEHYFFSNLKSVNWIKPLYNHGFFSPETLKDRFFWNQSSYLEFLSKQIKDGDIEKENSEILVQIINEVCEYSVQKKEINNYRIWYTFITILSNIPKEFISDEIIGYLNIFFDTRHENVLESEAIFKLLNSYFFDKQEAVNYKARIEKIVKLVFAISDKEKFIDRSTYETGKYHPIVRSYKLKETCKKEEFYKPIANFCSNEVIFFVADNLLVYLESEYISSFQIRSIYYLDEEDRHSYSIQTIYTTFLKNCCLEIASSSTERINEIIWKFLKNYKHSHFIKICLFIISKTWSQTKYIFFELIKEKDRKKLFSNSFWGDDLYFFLEEISVELEHHEELILEQIIENGSQNKDYYNKEVYLLDYKLRWYSALSSNFYFKEKFDFLNQNLLKSREEFRPEPNVSITIGSRSPISVDEINSMEIVDFTELLKSFDPVRSFKSPCVEGLTGNLETVVRENPNLFCDNYKYFLGVPYRHISSIFYGITETFKNGNNLNKENAILFIREYINQEEFGTNRLKLKNASFKYDHLLVISSFCRFISFGLREDNKGFSDDLLPSVEGIIFSFISTEYEGIGKLGSAMHAINNTTGVIIGCLLEYSLRKARLIKSDINKKEARWSIKEKEKFDVLVEKGVQELYMYFGWRRRNFYFLDYEWTNNLIKQIPKKDTQTIKSYFGCHLLDYNTSELDYKIFKDIYIKAINENWQIEDSTMGDNSIELHSAVFYIFNFEDLNKDEIITLIFDQKKIKRIRKIIHSLSFKFDQYFKELSPEDKVLFRKKVFKVWERTLAVLEESTDVGAKEMPTLFYLMKYIDELNDENYNLIKRTSNFGRQGRDFDELIKNLNRLKVQGDTEKSGIYACNIFVEAVFNDYYYASIMQNEIVEFVAYFYQQNSSKLKEYADKICNQFAENGQYFLRELYENHN